MSNQLCHAAIKAVVFDFGGVCVYFNERSIVEFIAKEFNIPVETVKKELLDCIKPASSGQINEDTVWPDFANRCQVTIPENWKQNWETFFSKNLQLNAPIFSIIESLQEQGFQTPLLSNILPSQAAICRQEHKFDAFTQVFLSCEIGSSKPDFSAYQTVIDQLQLKPEECLFVDDSPANVEGAKKAGMDSFCFNCKKDRIDLVIKELAARGITVTIP